MNLDKDRQKDRYNFPKQHRIYKIFNKNTTRISYSSCKIFSPNSHRTIEELLSRRETSTVEIVETEIAIP